MTHVVVSRRATTDEIVREMDRRGEAIEQLEARIAQLTLERDAWRTRESETQELLQKIGEEFGVPGGEPRTDGLLRVLRELSAENCALKNGRLEVLDAAAAEAEGVEPELLEGKTEAYIRLYCRARVDAACAIRALKGERANG